jgi:hypothetical protein
MDCILFGVKFKLFQTYINLALLIYPTYKWEENVNITVLYKIRTYISWRSGQLTKIHVIAQPWANSWYTDTEHVSLDLKSKHMLQSEANQCRMW